jgi:hypothetical protein
LFGGKASPSGSLFVDEILPAEFFGPFLKLFYGNPFFFVVVKRIRDFMLF